jgi:ankyrin repeat protein
MAPLKVKKQHIYDNVLKFLILRLAEIKGGFDAGGHSMITLLCTSEVESVIPPLLKCLVELCPDFQESDIWGNTPFHLMVRQQHLSTLQYVDSEMNIDINAQEFERLYTALHDAVLLQSTDAIKILLELGAEPDLQDREGNSPLHHATLLSTDLSNPILNGGANPNILNHLGETPLNLAIKHGLKSQIGLLIKKGGKIAEDAQGITPLMLAAKVGQIVSMETILKLQIGNITERETIELVRYNKTLSSKKRRRNRFWRFHCRLIKENDLYAAAFASLETVSTERRQK